MEAEYRDSAPSVHQGGGASRGMCFSRGGGRGAGRGAEGPPTALTAFAAARILSVGIGKPIRAINSVGECYLHTVEVGSSNLPSPIIPQFDAGNITWILVRRAVGQHKPSGQFPLARNENPRSGFRVPDDLQGHGRGLTTTSCTAFSLARQGRPRVAQARPA